MRSVSSRLSLFRFAVLTYPCGAPIYCRHSGLAEADGWAEEWSSARQVALELALDDSKDGVHAGASVRYWQQQVLLNRYCVHAVPHADATCCREAPPVAGAQLVLLLSLPVWYTYTVHILYLTILPIAHILSLL